jgi:serralysin
MAQVTGGSAAINMDALARVDWVGWAGSVTYGSDGTPAGGIITGVTAQSGGVVSFVVTGLSINASLAGSFLSQGDITGLRSYVLSGDDGLIGGANADRIYTGDGNDAIYAGEGADFVYGQAGNDYQEGQGGNDVMDGGLGSDTLYGGTGNDALGGAAGDDSLSGQDGADYLLGSTDNDVVSGDAGNDSLRGQEGDDTLSGGDGDDWLYGDKGSNLATGGTGADMFIFHPTAGRTVIADFSAAAGDRIIFEGGTLAYAVGNEGGSLRITFDGGATAIVYGIAPASFSADWILQG